MVNQVLWKKFTEVKDSNFYFIMCDEYTGTSNKEQLSIWISDL